MPAKQILSSQGAPVSMATSSTESKSTQSFSDQDRAPGFPLCQALSDVALTPTNNPNVMSSSSLAVPDVVVFSVVPKRIVD